MDLTHLNGREVKIVNQIYTIKLKRSIKNGSLLGESDHSKELIKLSTHQSISSFADTLLHEILHCIWYVNGVGYVLDAEEIEEFVVHSYASTLMAVFNDNPWVVEFIEEVIKRHK